MFENDTINSLYNQTLNFQKLSQEIYNLSTSFACLSIFYIISAAPFLYIITKTYSFTFTPILIFCLFTLIYLLSTRYFLLKNNKIDTLQDNLIEQLSNQEIQLEIINFFDSNRIDTRQLQVQFINKNYYFAINVLTYLLSYKIYLDEQQKQLIEDNQLIESYRYELELKKQEQHKKTQIIPKLKLVT